MHFTSEQQHLVGVDERRFVVGDVPGILWTPPLASPNEPVPLIMAGQPGGPAGLDRTRPRLLERATRAAQSGFVTATIELPGSGDQPPPAGMNEARAELRAAISAGQPISDELTDRLVLPLVEAAVPQWQTTLDALLGLPDLREPVGYSGGNISIATQLVAVEPRVAAAVLFAGSLIPRVVVEAARRITVPVYVLLQWDDEGNDRQQALDLFDAFRSREKTLNANMGGHTGVPEHAGEEATRFLVRHLR